MRACYICVCGDGKEGYTPSKGTASEVAGIVSATMLRKTVNDKRIVTPETRISIFCYFTCSSRTGMRRLFIEIRRRERTHLMTTFHLSPVEA